MAILTYIHDPMCSWCFGFSNALGALMDSLPATIQVHRLLRCLHSHEYFEWGACRVDANIDIFGKALNNAKAFG